MSKEQKKTIFRQQSLDRLGSPEQLTDYFHVTNIGVWVFISMIILPAGRFFCMGFSGEA